MVVTVHRMYPELAQYIQLSMTGETQEDEVDVNVMNRLTLLNHCHVVRIDRDLLSHEAGVTECHQPIVTEIARTMIVVIKTAVDVATISVKRQDSVS